MITPAEPWDPKKALVRVVKGRHTGSLGYLIPWRLNSYRALPADEGGSSYFLPVVLAQDPVEVRWLHETAFEAVP